MQHVIMWTLARMFVMFVSAYAMLLWCYVTRLLCWHV